MRVLLVAHRYPPDGIAGVERYTEALAHALVADGDEVAVVAPGPLSLSRRPELRRERKRSGPVVYRLAGGAVTLERFLADHERLERLFTMALVEAEPDIVHVTHLFGLPPRLVALSQRLRVPVVVTLSDFYFACPLLHLQKRSGVLCEGPDEGRECEATCFSAEPAPERWRLRARYFRSLLESVDRVLCGSAAVAEYFERFAPRAAPIRVVPHGVAVPPADGDQARRHSSDGRLRLVYLGSVVPHKGVDLVVDAVEVAGVEADFTIAGRIFDAEYERHLRGRAAAVPSLRVRFVGAYALSEVPAILREADLVVVPSRVPEVVPFVPREALSQGVPVLVGRLGGLPEIVVERENGLTFDSSDPAELAAILARLSEDETLLERLRRGARETYVPTAAEHSRELRSVYEEVVLGALNRAGDLPATASEELEGLHASLVEAGFAEPPGGASETLRSDE